MSSYYNWKNMGLAAGTDNSVPAAAFDPGPHGYGLVAVQSGARLIATDMKVHPVDLRQHGAARINPLAAFQDIKLGFRLGDLTIDAGACRLPPGLALDENGLVVNSPAQSLDFLNLEPRSVAASLFPESLRSRLNGCRLSVELTGGVDSRFVLAALASFGDRPSIAFTIGDDTDPDVIVARKLAGALGIEHLLIRVADHPSLLDDARDYCRRSGFYCSASKYAWLPNVFRQLDAVRDAQLSGVGGERIGGFYGKRMERLVSSRVGRAWWAKYRLGVPGANLRLFRAGHIARSNQETEDMLDDIWARTGSGARFFQAVYESERIRNWAAPALIASGSYYEVVAPLMGDSYGSLADSVRSRGLDPRGFMRSMTIKMFPAFAGVPYATDLANGGQNRMSPLSRAARMGRKIVHRIRPHGVRSTLGMQSCARDLCADPRFRVAVEQLCSECGDWLVPGVVHDLMDSPETAAHEIGFIATWAFALQQNALGAAVAGADD